MELREKIHQRMRDKLFLGHGPDHDLFEDIEEMFERHLSDSLGGVDKFEIESENFKSQWEESQSGRTLVITPKDKDQKLNIDVNNSLITIRGETYIKTPTTSMKSSFSNSFSVPPDCDSSLVKIDQVKGNILIYFPFFKAGPGLKSAPQITPQKNNERRPIPPTGEEVSI
jgi:hypothetical protein